MPTLRRRCYRQSPPLAEQAHRIARSIRDAGHSLAPQDARATWQRYGLADDPAQQCLVRALLDALGRTA